MSLVNDMLRDLEARRASPAERAPLAGLQPVDEGAGQRRGRRRLWALLGLLALLLAALLAARFWLATSPGAALAVAAGTPAPATEPEPLPALAPEADSRAVAEPTLRLLATLPQHSRERFVLQLLLDGAPEYLRSEQSGAVSLRLPHLQLGEQGPRAGGFAGGGRSLNWSLLPVDGGVELLLVGLGDALQVFDRLEPAGERWQLWVEVPLEARSEADFDPASLPVAGAVEEPWADAPLAAAPDERRPAAPAVAPAAPGDGRQPPALAEPAAQPLQSAPPRRPQLSVASHQPDALGEARQALLAGEHGRAVALLEALNRHAPDNREALRWLARAWLAAGHAERLRAELPAQLQRFPDDSELRVLLARAQLQGGASAAAVATLAARLPPLAGDPAYHALLAASYQQTGQWQESARLYRSLVQLRPAQASWQLGLGIALEQLGERDAAAQHYRQALQGQGLDEDSRRYARERAQALGGNS